MCERETDRQAERESICVRDRQIGREREREYRYICERERERDRQNIYRQKQTE